MGSRLVVTKRGTGHSYSLDGAYVPGVTTVLSKSLPSDALIRWSAKEAASWAATHHDLYDVLGEEAWVRQVADAPRANRDAAASAGSAVHGHAQALLSGEAPHVPEYLTAHVEHAADFLDTWDVQELAAERPCAHAEELRIYRYGGTFDLIATLRDGRTWLLDYKTGTGVYAKTALQLAAYRFADFYQDESGRDVPMPRVDACGVVHIRPDGWRLVPVVAEARVYEYFRHCCWVAEWTKLTDGWPDPSWPVIGAALPRPEAVA